MTRISDNLSTINERIHTTALRCGRSPDEITLLAVSKKKPVGTIREAWDAGQRRFGENYVQEAIEKITALHDLPIEWHYIGSIQSNKTRLIAENFDWVHGVDSLRQAHRLSSQRPADLNPLNICLQINISNEESKGGIDIQETESIATEISRLPNVQLRGLMALPAPTNNLQQQAGIFSQMQQLFEQLNSKGLNLDTLSMGMSNDMEEAIRHGATIVRVGTAIFGQRD
ncbi:YggS family pyridoxal phosphate-dependent enzyme [Solemya velum gill symbiont]|uniref:Pyridoxal phosphate homeostasis protein n=1 Tax=Solemya velum gill symbiont TaxID=2340 RepID=A0A0B0HA44_SOVGS|nr:YggS family pyridoxal phosphate-dependent enzyme [Solemya velum gill symbiont]KHF25537.1 pyridoxal phosphate enzyme [Solemya velum gill symbiont]OOY35369.1 YggS family pyridoxal phosphate enzyme [Solemya velum gill symbiont]OOY38040.1 YggS family pyridoxal phosphate enzyme [Solemya velum gill symbiont]OOY39382.1 YggS family pyridoxal phosphate enzyme [Solemya velum gill symbiont]OOY46607.1 YggS family pyridoxal phosphate enzyme [Solemya velum gill symbiont]